MPYSRLCNRLQWLVTAMLKFINKWNHQITRANYILQKVPQNKCNNRVSLLVSNICLSWIELEFILFWRIFLKILKPSFLQKTLCSLESTFASFFMFIKLQIKNKQLLMNNYSCKVSQSDINNQVPLTPHSRLFNRLRWLVTAVLNFINKWNQWIKKAQDILHKVSQSKFKNSSYLLITRFCLNWNGFCSNWFP